MLDKYHTEDHEEANFKFRAGRHKNINRNVMLCNAATQHCDRLFMQAINNLTITSVRARITACAARSALFYSDNKYKSGCNWPSFAWFVAKGTIRYLEYFLHNMYRIEISCGKYDAHLWHKFPDGPQTTCERYCVNSALLSFIDGTESKKVDG
ncbi:MAG: peptide-methionine (R)-S-oxide reductase [Candidatus Malihini olakiniferum]